MKKVLVWIICLAVVIFSGYMLNKKDVKLGKYVYGSSEDVNYSYIILRENNEFEFMRNLATSYNPSGKYKIDGNMLILNAVNDLYKFKIDGDKLIFLSADKDTALIGEGTVFVLEKN